jgi:hypothetical protein
MIPYKHYGSDTIEDVVDEVVGSDDLETENGSMSRFGTS